MLRQSGAIFWSPDRPCSTAEAWRERFARCGVRCPAANTVYTKSLRQGAGAGAQFLTGGTVRKLTLIRCNYGTDSNSLDERTLKDAFALSYTEVNEMSKTDSGICRGTGFGCPRRVRASATNPQVVAVVRTERLSAGAGMPKRAGRTRRCWPCGMPAHGQAAQRST